MKRVKIKNPTKSWWSGDPSVEPYMKPVVEALGRHMDRGKVWTDIYNRAYEAVYKAMSDNKEVQAMKKKFKTYLVEGELLRCDDCKELKDDGTTMWFTEYDVSDDTLDFTRFVCDACREDKP